MKLSSSLLLIERTAVSGAALAAIFPIWQYASETDDRELDRAANFVLAYRACFGEDGVQIEEKNMQEIGSDVNLALARQAALARSSGHWNEDAANKIVTQANANLLRISETMAESCQRLEQLYRLK